jgi:hypothetical protein
MNMKKLFLTAACVFVCAVAVADIMPEPQIIYIFKYSTPNALKINPESSEQIQCADALCMEQSPLGIYGLQRLNCTDEKCFAASYEFKPFQKLVVGFSDGKIRESQIFKIPRAQRGAMQVNVTENGLEVLNLPDFVPQDHTAGFYIAFSLFSIVLLELAAAFIFLKVEDLSLSILISVLIANLISAPLGWLVFSDKIHNMSVIWLASFIFEFFFVFLCNRSRITFKKTAGLILVANIASFSLGMVISYMLVSL